MEDPDQASYGDYHKEQGPDPQRAVKVEIAELALPLVTIEYRRSKEAGDNIKRKDGVHTLIDPDPQELP